MFPGFFLFPIMTPRGCFSAADFEPSYLKERPLQPHMSILWGFSAAAAATAFLRFGLGRERIQRYRSGHRSSHLHTFEVLGPFF